jgi:hypothetical protein
MKALNSIIGALVVVGVSAFSAPSQAAPHQSQLQQPVSVYRNVINHATAACMGSMQVDREMLRGRSMGLSNITAASVSDVRCGGVATPYNHNGDVEIFETALRNSTAASVDVNCMLADGLEDGIFSVSTKYPKTITIAAGEVAWIDWTTADNGGNNFIYPSLICQLPTDVSISYTAILYQVDVGN